MPLLFKIENLKMNSKNRLISAVLSGLMIGTCLPAYAEQATSQVDTEGSLILHNRMSRIATAYTHGDKADVVWDSEAILPYSLTRTVKPVANGHLMAIARVKNKRKSEVRVTKGKPGLSQIVELDPAGNVVWQFKADETTLPDYHFIHHDFFVTPQNTVMLLTSGRRTDENVAAKDILDDAVIEINRAGKLLWQWSALDHIDQLGLSDSVRHKIMDKSLKKRRRKNKQATADYRPMIDVFHANSIQVIPPNRFSDNPIFKPGNLLISLRNVNRGIIVDKATGDVVWSLKLATINQHHIRMIPPGLPGAGNILLFDNGGRSFYTSAKRAMSRILEVDPIEQTIVWSYQEPTSSDENRLFSEKMSSAQRLPNGNTLILNSVNSRVFEVDTSGNVVWDKPAESKKKGVHYRAYWASRDWRSADYFSWW